MDILNKIKESLKSNLNTLKEWVSSPVFLSIASYISLLIAFFADSILLLLISLGLAGYSVYLAFKFED
ncbi:MAG: hypothetical protein GOVbin2604_43 [Gammaproteobacteria virus GOV_bin_2604]|nr:MAG: hypothetical protein GOVbin2604_43 [Gammaproteobacteria virus GOV_bin_2604]|tara:strand:- start:86 stop:289 length:204 start_codon:yes stop_codon:yes gene_type:complete